MSPVSSGASYDVRASVKQQCNVAVLNHSPNGFSAIDECALVSVGEAEQYCCNIARGQCGVERGGERRRIVELGSAEIKPGSWALGVHLLAMPLCAPDRLSTAPSQQVRSSWRGD